MVMKTSTSQSFSEEEEARVMKNHLIAIKNHCFYQFR